MCVSLPAGVAQLCLLLFFQLTYVDFPFYELLDQHKLFDRKVLNDFPNLQVSQLHLNM